MAELVELTDDLGPVARRALRSRLRSAMARNDERRLRPAIQAD
jgi:hypothetical protein